MPPSNTNTAFPVIDVVALTRDLVAARSENPPGSETLATSVVAGVLQQAGFQVDKYEPETNRSNVVARLRRGPGRRLIFQAHCDTKPATPPGVKKLWSTDPFHAVERNGRLYGLGACDTKGGLAAQVVAACALAADPGWSGELIVQAVADEEDGSRLGAQHLLDRGLLDADGAVVSEPTGCAPSIAQLGNAWAEITIVGRGAHAGHPERGQDAFRAALSYVSTIEELLARMNTWPQFPGHPRLNVGDVAMPGHPGTVPGECRLRCDIRVLPAADREDTLRLYETAATTVRTAFDVSVMVERYQSGGCQSHYLDADHRLAQAFAEAQVATGQTAHTNAFAGGTDARYFALAGTPALVYGPGSLEQAHAPDEFVSIAELRLAENHLVAAAIAFFRSNNDIKAKGLAPTIAPVAGRPGDQRS
jgi:acetylornithine deacetylase/succinyl-diaminopimelate desuccinylase family protein